ncbi:uncharacterized protein SPPG_07092 [Spizellomyces punctatus DAOM BR117]|uniref:ADP-ribosylation factor-like protein 2-binding protein n=1 Tax=Spizellomyces punctatus (strain DAOM BR117) TaxID=645134 RepID=A0A0L0H9P8_SPIPD|nr:uncharacterized protein SPPG_07092 [Spizellomyces punctatus DAOM BR117]KNC97624.1 hypothetical protein SPPG_07092 [Spizellomyces punctatus DAOM BR117]|eukprot:XP_016605664.1 hypothetical protein SPPG_07092 [Spizellomyces punctatus DAOM BR117]
MAATAKYNEPIQNIQFLEEDMVLASETNAQDATFDSIVGELEDMLMDPYFISLQESLLSENCHHFTDDEENKLVYMDVFQQYVSKLEQFIEKRLKSRLPGFSMADFMGMIKNRPEQLDGDVFDVLSSLADFNAFKDLILSYKNEQQGLSLDLSDLLAVQGTGSSSGAMAVAAERPGRRSKVVT